MTRVTNRESRGASSGAHPLAGRGIVVTRPARQAQALARAIEDAGGRALLFPAIEIRDVADMAPFLGVVERLEDYDLAIFISPNAVERAMKLIGARRRLPAGLRVAAVGGGTRRALERLGVTGVLAPQDRYDSEALLELPALAAAGGRRVVIFRGRGGRELLAERLRERGAQVDYAECYVRRRPDADPAPLLAQWERGAIDAVIVTSSEALRNLFAMLGDAGRGHLRRTPLFVTHPRIAQAARRRRVETVIVTGPGDAGLIAGLADHFGRQGS
jgi:uroporphyrinogen-III synthase